MRLGDGEIFRGEGILAVTKAILQSGVAYVGGYQGAPVSHLVDVLVELQDLLDELGVHLETCTNEASAAALLGASINYPLRGCVTWKSIVGTNVAADALSNLASPGVIGGALIVVGEDYGEGASIIQERAHAYALKSSLWLMDPRPNLPSIVRCTEKAFELSEATNTPVMMELRIRACHVTGEFLAKDNKPPPVSRNQRLANPAPHNYDRISHPPSTYAHEKIKVEVRQPAAQRFIVEHGLNEFLAGERSDLGIIVQGGITNVLLRGLDRLEVEGQVPTLVLNVTHPLVPDQIADFCKGKRAVLIVEEGGPDYIEQAVHAILRKRDIDTKIYGKDVLPMAGEYTAEVVTDGPAEVLRPVGQRHRPFQAARALRGGARRPRRGPAPAGRAAAAQAAGLLRRLSRAAGLLGHQAARARGRQGPYLERHRLPFLRDPGAVQPRQLDPGLRHVARRRGRGGAGDAEAHHLGDGRRRLLAQRAFERRRLGDVQSRRSRAGDHAERLHLGHRRAVHPQHLGQPPRRRDDVGHRRDPEGDGREMAAHHPHLQCRHHA